MGNKIGLYDADTLVSNGTRSSAPSPGDCSLDAETLVSNGTWSCAPHIEEELLVKQVVASVRKALR